MRELVRHPTPQAAPGGDGGGSGGVRRRGCRCLLAGGFSGRISGLRRRIWTALLRLVSYFPVQREDLGAEGRERRRVERKHAAAVQQVELGGHGQEQLVGDGVLVALHVAPPYAAPALRSHSKTPPDVTTRLRAIRSPMCADESWAKFLIHRTSFLLAEQHTRALQFTSKCSRDSFGYPQSRHKRDKFPAPHRLKRSRVAN